MPFFKCDDRKNSIITILLIVIIGIGAYLVSEISEMNQYEKESQQVYESYNRMKVDYIFAVINEYYRCADNLAEEIKTNIIYDVKLGYGNDVDRLKADLNNTDKNNALNKILNKNIEGVYFNNMQNDANDPFISTQDSIVSDLSADCAVDTGAENKSNRTFEEEATMHFNKKLAAEFFTSMTSLKEDSPFWIFPKPQLSLPWYADLKGLEHMNIGELKSIVLKHDGDLEVIKQVEFIRTAVIYSNSDLAGNPTVSHNGYKNLESNQIFVNTPFNAYDSISADPLHMETLQKFEMQKSNLESVVSTNIRNKTILIMVVSVMLVIMFVAVIKITDDIV